MKPRHQRLVLILAGLLLVMAATAQILSAFRSNLVFFFTPTQVVQGEVPRGSSFRIGGLVVPGSLQRATDDLAVRFQITDTAQIVPVVYSGILPDLFREGKGVVAQGKVGPDGTFHASEVLAKHDENYMPPEAAEALKQAGRTGTYKQATP